MLVLCGGASSERIVSLASGDSVAKWCAALGHDVFKYDPERPGKFYSAEETIAPSAIGLVAPNLDGHRGFDARVVRGLLDAIETHKIDVVFPILHGGYGEDGTLQSLLEWVNVSYTGSGPRSCALAMHKPTAKTVLGDAAGFRLRTGSLFKRTNWNILMKFAHESQMKLAILLS